MRHTDTSSFLQEKKSRRRGVRFSGGDQSRLGRRDPIQPLRNPIKYKPPGLRFPFCSQNPSRLSVPLQPRTAPRIRRGQSDDATPRHAAEQTSTARNRVHPPKPSLVAAAAVCVHLPQIFFLASHPGLGLSGRRRPSSCGASSARP
jgi:hypothetical protein